MSPLGVVVTRAYGAARLSAISRGALDRPLVHEAELLVAEPSDAAIVLGAFQRRSEIEEHVREGDVVLRRGSGGAEARLGPGTIWMQLALASSDALVACEPSRLLNRYVRPLLRALGKSGALAHYFDRDWISASKRPVGMITLAHDARSGRALVEAIVAVSSPFAVRDRPSYLGKAPATIAELGTHVDTARLSQAIVQAYAAAFARSPVSMDDGLDGVAAPLPATEPPWSASRTEPIGLVAAGRDRHGRLRIGGELMASRDALEQIEDAVAASNPTDAAVIDRAIDEAFHGPHVALAGVRSLASLRDVIVEALAATGTT